MPNFTTKQGALFYCYAPPAEQLAKIDKWLSVLDQSGVANLLGQRFSEKAFGRPGLNPLAMFATILFGFAFGSQSLRELESSCKYDLRFIYLMNGDQPDYSTFSKFINKIIKPQAEEIFARTVASYLQTCHLDLEECHIDGTKFEAKPNKYKVVWKPIAFQQRLSDKIRSLLMDLNLSRGVPAEGIISSSLLAKKIIEADDILSSANPENNKILKKKINNLTIYLSKTIEYEEKIQICGENRNSYYKTDHDATAMCLKEDYYSGLGSNMHAAYQMQTIVCHGFVVAYYVSQDRADMHTFIPTLERFRAMYGRHPTRLTADSGYGCLDNYVYCKRNNIEAFIKYLSWQGESSARRPALYELKSDNTILCLGQRIGHPIKVPGRHHKIKSSEFFKIECDPDCAFMPYCRARLKEEFGTERIFEISIEYQKLKQEARDRLLSVKGIEMRVNRSCQIEGLYGIAKHNIGYNRIRRTGMANVAVEYMLVLLGLNTRKLFRYFDGKTDFSYWKAPEGLLPQEFKKPFAKRLANRARKAKKKSSNEIASDSYRYKFKRKKKGIDSVTQT